MEKQDRLISFISIGMKAGAYTLGSQMTEKAARAGKVRLMLLSNDAAENTKKLIRNVAKSRGIDVIEHYPMNIMGRACGKENLSVIGVKNEKIALKITEIYNESIKRGNA